MTHCVKWEYWRAHALVAQAIAGAEPGQETLYFGANDNPEEGTVNDAVSDLRRKLRPLGINIKFSRKVGRMLVEIVAKPKPGKKPKRSKGRKRQAK